jgi:hypothetical protein
VAWGDFWRVLQGVASDRKQGDDDIVRQGEQGMMIALYDIVGIVRHRIKIKLFFSYLHCKTQSFSCG